MLNDLTNGVMQNLYVAITRPRNRLWILETKTNAFIDMLATKLDNILVDIRHFTQQDVGFTLYNHLR